MICRKMADNINKNQETENRMVFFGSKGINYNSKNVIYNNDKGKFEEYFKGAEDIKADTGYDYVSFDVLNEDGVGYGEFLTADGDNFEVKLKELYKYDHDENDNLIIFKASNKAKEDKNGVTNSYANGREAVSQSLIQRLSLLEGELYHYIRAGFPSFKKANKNILDSYVVKVILNHPEVKSISSYQSKVEDRIYYMNANIITIYGELDFSKRQYM